MTKRPRLMEGADGDDEDIESLAPPPAKIRRLLDASTDTDGMYLLRLPELDGYLFDSRNAFLSTRRSGYIKFRLLSHYHHDICDQDKYLPPWAPEVCTMVAAVMQFDDRLTAATRFHLLDFFHNYYPFPCEEKDKDEMWCIAPRIQTGIHTSCITGCITWDLLRGGVIHVELNVLGHGGVTLIPPSTHLQVWYSMLEGALCVKENQDRAIERGKRRHDFAANMLRAVRAAPLQQQQQEAPDDHELHFYDGFPEDDDI